MNKKYDTNITTIDIETLYTQIEILKRFDLDAPYQRSIVWTDVKQSLFINSIILGIVPTPLIFVDKGLSEGGRTVIDGKQRITSIQRFKKNEIGCEIENSVLYYDKLPLSIEVNETYRVMTEEEKTAFNRSNLNCITYYGLVYADELLIFNRIQNGIAMASADLLKASVKDQNSNIVLNNFYDSLIAVLGKYSGNTIKEKTNHIIVITNIMYMVKYNKLKTCNKQDRELAVQNYEGILDQTSALIIDTFSWLNKHPIKLCNYMLYPVIYRKFQDKNYEPDLEKLVKNIKDHIIKKDYKSVYDHMVASNI